MKRPETITPEMWARLDDKQKKFVVEHEEMHAVLQRVLGISRLSYYEMCDQLAREGFGND